MFGVLKQKQLFGDAFWALFGQFGSALALLAGTRVLTEWITPAVYGQVALLNGFVALGVAVFSYPFICAGMRIVSECKNQLERADLYGVVAGLTACSTAMAIAFLMLGGGVYGYVTHSNIRLFALAGLLLAVTVRRELGIQLLIGERRQRGASLWQTSDSILRQVLAVCSVWWLGAKAEWMLLGYILASLLSNTVWSSANPRTDGKSLVADEASPRESRANAPLSEIEGYGTQSVHKSLKNDVWAYALPLIPMELMYWINGLGDRYVIGYFMTAAEVGLYAATYLLINEAFNRSAMILLRIFQPVYFQSHSLKQAKEGFRILWIWIACICALGIIGVLLLLVTKDWLAAWALAKSYHSAVELMPAMAVGCALHALGTVVAQPLLATKRTRRLLLGRIFGMLAAAVSIPLMVNNFGLLGAAMANPIYFGIEALVLAMLAKPWRITRPEHINASDRVEEETSGCRATA